MCPPLREVRVHSSGSSCIASAHDLLSFLLAYSVGSSSVLPPAQTTVSEAELQLHAFKPVPGMTEAELRTRVFIAFPLRSAQRI